MKLVDAKRFVCSRSIMLAGVLIVLMASCTSKRDDHVVMISIDAAISAVQEYLSSEQLGLDGDLYYRSNSDNCVGAVFVKGEWTINVQRDEVKFFRFSREGPPTIEIVLLKSTSSGFEVTESHYLDLMDPVDPP